MTSRPTSAFQFKKSNSQSSITWKPRPNTAVVPITSATNMNVSIDQSIDSEHANLPKDALGSRMLSSMTRPSSAFKKPAPAVKINTEALSKVCQSEDPPGSFKLESRFERISLVSKLRNLCSTKSYILLEGSNKEPSTNKTRDALINEIREIWEKSNKEYSKKRPQSAVNRTVKTVYIPRFDKEPTELPIIPEKKDFCLDPDIPENEASQLKKTCDSQVLRKEMTLNIPIFPIFPGKVMKRGNTLKSKLSGSRKMLIRDKINF